jgi:hypothetical protein
MTETSRGTDIVWYKRFGGSFWIAGRLRRSGSMASSFHWADFDRARDEFHRILRSGRVFVASWYPRFIEANPLLVEIDCPHFAAQAGHPARVVRTIRHHRAADRHVERQAAIL